jgi:hypothetical protein
MPAQDALPPVPLLDSRDALDVVVAASPRGPPVSSVAVSGVVSAPPPVHGPAGSCVVPCRCCCRWSWCVRLGAPPCAPLFDPRVSAVRRPFPPCFFIRSLLRQVTRQKLASKLYATQIANWGFIFFYPVMKSTLLTGRALKSLSHARSI